MNTGDSLELPARGPLDEYAIGDILEAAKTAAGVFVEPHLVLFAGNVLMGCAGGVAWLVGVRLAGELVVLTIPGRGWTDWF